MAKQRGGEGWSFRPAQPEEAPQTLRHSLAPSEHKCVVELDKRAKGKVVTVVRQLQLTAGDLKALGKALKNACGTGGTTKDGTVELQGDCRERAARWLDEKGWGRKK